MLKLTITNSELFDDETQEFIPGEKIIDLEFEHSLVSLSKWESIFQKPFLGDDKKTPEEIFEYIFLMLLTPNVDKSVMNTLSQKDLDAINGYIESKQSATKFGQMPKPTMKSETITAELIYYWMVAFNIPFECEHWHLNRLFALIRICNIKNGKPKKQSKAELAESYRDLNARRKAELGTSG